MSEPRYASRRGGQPNFIKRFSALCVRFVDDADYPDLRGVGMLMTGWCIAARAEARRQGRTSGSIGGVPPGMHPTKTKIVYCKDGKRKDTYPNVKFDFLGYSFRPRLVRRGRDNTLFCGFNPAVSASALKAMRATIRELNIRRQTQLSLGDIAQRLNPLLRGWIEYYGRYAPSALSPLLRYVNQTLLAWVMRKFKRLADHKIRASKFLQNLARDQAISSSWARNDWHVCLMGAG